MVITDITEHDLLERSIEEWYYFFVNKLRKIVKVMFGDEKETKELAYEKVDILKTAAEEVEKTLKTEGMAKLPKDLNKGELDFQKVHKIGGVPCKNCLGPITWEYRPGIAWPIHVDEMGKILGNGTCPEYKGDS